MAKLALLLALGVALGSCATETLTFTPGATSNSFVLGSPAFDDGTAIPTRYTCDAEDVSPPLTWTGVPEGVVAFALIAEDPDAGGFIHWVLADIPGDLRELPEGQGDVIGSAGLTSFGTPGWRGPCPPSGEHHYVFTLFALSASISVPPTPSAAAVRRALEPVLVGSARLVGVYARGG